MSTSSSSSIRDAIVRLCDPPSLAPSAAAVQALASLLQSRAAVDAVTARVVLECVRVQCVKVPVYAALVGVLNAKHPSFGRAVVELCHEALAAPESVHETANVVRFAGELARCHVLAPTSLAALRAALPACVRDTTAPWLVDEREEDACASVARVADLGGAAALGRPHEAALAAHVGEADALEEPEWAAATAFRCFARTDSESECPSARDRAVVEALVRDTALHCGASLTLATARLLALPVVWRYDWVLVETLLGALLCGPERHTLMLTAMLCQLLRQHVRLAGLYWRAADALFARVDAEPPVVRERAAAWLAVHATNFGLKWEWAAWAARVQGLPDEHAQVRFVRALLGRCVRLTYWARVDKALPDELRHLMPPYPKPAVADARAALAAPDADADAMTAMLAVLESGSTPTHVKAGLRRHGATLRAAVARSGDEARARLLHLVGVFWAHSEGHRLLVVDALLGALVLEPTAVVSWVLSEDGGSLLSYASWELLHAAVGKAQQRTAALRASSNPAAAAKLAEQLRAEKDLFLCTFQRLAIVLETYLAQHQPEPGLENAWFVEVRAQLAELARRYAAAIAPYRATLQSVVFSDDCDERIRSAFQ